MVSPAYALDIISVGVVGVALYPFLRFFQSHDSGQLAHGLGIALADMLSKVAKRLAAPAKVKAFMRPPGARDCDIMCRNGAVEGRPGMPSGHATMAAYFLVYFVGYELGGDLFNPSLWAAVLVFLLIAIARVGKRCHTLLQVAVGALLGATVAMGVLWGTGPPTTAPRPSS